MSHPAHSHATQTTASPTPGLLVVISGPSGVGKTTITRALEQRLPDAAFSVSVTTRPRTPTDRDGVDYTFLTDAQFDDLVARHELLEWANVFGKRYGTPRAPVARQLEQGRVVLLEIDVEGARQVKHAMPEAAAMFILPPSEPALLERLRHRAREDEAAIQRRFAGAQREIAAAHAAGVYDLFITNVHLDRAIDQALAFVNQRRSP